MGRSEIGKKRKKRKGSSKLDEDEEFEIDWEREGTLEESACHAPAL